MRLLVSCQPLRFRAADERNLGSQQGVGCFSMSEVMLDSYTLSADEVTKRVTNMCVLSVFLIASCVSFKKKPETRFP